MKGKRGAVPRSEYEHLPSTSFRERNGKLLTAYFSDDGTVYVKQVADHVTVSKLTEDEWTNVYLNHGLIDPTGDQNIRD